MTQAKHTEIALHSSRGRMGEVVRGGVSLGVLALALALPQAAQAQSAPGAAVVFLPPVPLTGAPAQCVNSNSGDTSSSGISSDGSIVAGGSSNSGCIVLWRNGVPQLQAGINPEDANLGNYFFVNAMSGDGRTLVGYVGNAGSTGCCVNGYNVGPTEYWTANAGTQLLPAIETLTAAQFNANPPIAIRSVSGSPARATIGVERIAVGDGFVNGDGTFFAVNSAYFGVFESSSGDSAFPQQFDGRVLRWSPTNGYQQLPTFGSGIPMGARGIDSSGNRIVGLAVFSGSSQYGDGSEVHAFLWDAAGGLSRLPDLTAAFADGSLLANSSATSISRDGSTVIGYSRATDGLLHPVFWRNGSITDIGFLSGRTPTDTSSFAVNFHEALAVSAGGSIIVGRANGVNESTAWRWSATTGMQDLNVIARNAGLNLNGFILNDAVGVSDNGQFITGNSFNAAQSQSLGYVLQLAQITQSRLIVTIRLPGVTLSSIVNQSFSTQVDGLLNGQSVFTRTVTDPITSAGGVSALADARAALQMGSGLRRVVIGAPVLISNTTTVTGTTNAVVEIASGTSTSTASVNTFGPATVATGNFGTCATPAANNVNPTGCSLPGTPTMVDAGILNSNVFTNTLNTVTPQTTPTVNQLISAKWQVSASAGNQFGTVHALVGPVAFDRGDRLIGQLLGMGGADGSSPVTRATVGGTGLNMFGGYFGNWQHIDADARVPVANVRGNTNGFMFGLEKALGDGRVGVAVDHGTSDYTVRDPQYLESLSLKHTQVALFGGWNSGRFSLDGAAAYGFGTAKTVLATPTTPATGSRDVHSWSLGAQAGYTVPLGSAVSAELVAGVRHGSARLSRFTEVGGPNPLIGLNQTVTRTRIYSGVEAEVKTELGGVQITPSLHARAAHDSGDANGTADLVFANAPNGPVLTAMGPGVGKTVAELGGSLDAAISNTVHLWVGYDGSFRSGSKSHAAKAGFTVKW
jgi:probable HAF family extracellular repeat protein